MDSLPQIAKETNDDNLHLLKHHTAKKWGTIKKKSRRENVCAKPSFSTNLVSSQHLLDLGNSTSRVQTLGAGSRAVENGVATVDAHAVVQGVLTLGGLLVSGVGQPAVGLEQDGGTKVLLAVPPV